MYKLVANYTTGNSFGSEEIEDELIHEFESKEVALNALRRLKEHYEWFDWEEKSEYDKQRSIRHYNAVPIGEPEWHKELEYSFQANYYNDLGNLITLCIPYGGYFETLHSLEVKDDSYKAEFN